MAESVDMDKWLDLNQHITDQDFEDADWGNEVTEEIEDEENPEDDSVEEIDEDSDEEIEEDSDEDSDEEPEEEEETVDPLISRLDQENAFLKEQLQALMGQVNSLTQPKQEKKEAPKPPEFDFDGKEDEYAVAVLEGDTQKASKIRREINKAHKAERDYDIAMIKQGLEESNQQAPKSAADIEDVRFELARDKIEAKYPVLDHTSKEYHEDTVEMINSLMVGYVQKGMTKTQALNKAIKSAGPLLTNKKPVSKQKKVSSEREVKARKKAVSAQKRQPRTVSGKKGGESKEIDLKSLDISKMSDKDFAKLSSRELAILQGDIV